MESSFFLLSHSKDIVQADLFSSLLNQKAVRIKQEDEGKDGHDHHTKSKDTPHTVRSRHLSDTGVVHDHVHVKKHHDGDDARKQKRDIGPLIFFQIGKGKPDVNRFKHTAHLP